MAATPRARIALRAPTGDLVAGIRARAAAMSKAQRQVAVAMLHAPDFALRANVDDLARRAGVSPPTIVRFCRALGFAGLKDFKLRLAQSLAVETSALHRAVAPGDTMAAVVHKVLRGAANALTNLEQHIVPEAVEAAVVRIARARRVDCYSVGNTSMFMANDAQARFSRLGLASNAYFDAYLQLASAANLDHRDVVLAISHTGCMAYLLDSVGVARARKAAIVAMTEPGTPLAGMADIVLPIGVPADPSMRVGTEAYLAQIAYLEILMVGVGLRRGAAALGPLMRARDVLREHGVAESHPVLRLAGSKDRSGAAR